MRLICPNCDAEYEVDDAAIPDAGRDVQCSNCGHAWFQGPPEVEPATAVIDQPDPDATSVDEAEANEAPPSDMPPDAAPDAPQPRTVDDSVLAILKEEAERELSARREEEAVPVETQPDLGLDAGPAAARAQQIAMMRGEAATAEPAKQVTRRELLPDIEEINSTLRPSAAVRHDEDEDDDGPMALPQVRTRSGFRSGFVLMLLLAAVLVALYLMAPRLAQQIPGAKGALDAYVAGVDQARVGLDGATKSVIAALQRWAGSE
jgi:predicted Zn finger-like uncharacterized protein